MEKDDGITSVILVCHHNTIRYMMCALSNVYETRYPNIHFNTINASYIDVQFYKHLASANWTYCVANKGELNHTPQTTISMTSYDASDIVMVGNAFDENFVMEHIVSSEEGRLVVYAIDKNRPDLQTSINDMKFIKSQLPKLSVELTLVPEYILTTNVGTKSKPLKPGKVSRENAVAMRLTSGITKVIFYEKWYPIHRNYNIPGQLISLNVYSVWWVFILARDHESYKGYILQTRDMTDLLFERIPNNFDVPLYIMIANQGDDNIEFEEY
ncbi:phosphoglycerate mutase family protein [Emiliania huxleyi virus 18]|nr:phosphoglycerate mutase family protein [Emiliania huxleyi virus 18]